MPKSAQELFAAALELTNPADRAVLLGRECVGNSALRAEVESLLASHEQASQFLENPPAAPVSETLATTTGTIPVSEKPGDQIGRYKLLQKIGEGGCGVVYMAEQEEPIRRRVALKVIKLGMDTRQVIARFQAERQALALMDHPNIAKVLDAGATETGRPYFVMELVRGVRITDYCEEHKRSIPERLELFMQVCAAVQHAHQKGIIHRDIKPSNVLVMVQDNKPVPKVIDFGIAKAMAQRLTDKTLFTAFQQVIGTPAYMSPEQAGANREDIDTRSDIYSLGVLLYELLTGKTPFETRKLMEAGLEAIFKTIREEEPPKPSARLTTLTKEELAMVAARRRTAPERLGKLVRGEPDWIVMKCLEKDRTRRYDTANGLALDIQRHLTNEPVVAAPQSMAYRLQRLVRRHRVALVTASAFLLVLLSGIVMSTWQWRRAVVAQGGEAHQRRVAETNAVQRREQLVRLDVANGVRAMENDDWFGALLWFTEALRQDQPGSRAEAMHRYRIGALLTYTPRLTQVWSHGGPINHATFSPDGLWALTSSRDQTTRLWNVLTGQPGAVLPHGSNVLEATFSADGRRVVTRSDDGTVRVWNPGTGQMVCPLLELGYRVTHALISPDGQRVFTAGNPTETNLTETVHLKRSEENPEAEVRIWDASTGRLVRPPFRRETLGDQQLALSPDGEWLAASFGGTIMVWNLRQPRAIHLVGGDKAQATMLPGLEPDKTSAELEGLLPNVPRLRKSRGLVDAPWVACLAFSPDSRRLVTAYGDDSARIWAMRDGTAIVLPRPKAHKASVPSSPVRVATFSPDGHRVILVEDGIVRWWDAHTGEAEGQLKGEAAHQVWFSPDGRHAFLSAQVWDIDANEAVSPRPLHPGLLSAAFSADGATLLTAGTDGTARLWNLAGALPRQPPFKHDWPSVMAHRAAPEDSQPRNSREDFLHAILTSRSDLRDAAFSPDGRRVVTVSMNGSARAWDVASGNAVTPFVNLGWPLETAAFSPDGTRFLVAGGSPPDLEQGVARVWDAQTGQPLTPLIKHPEVFVAAGFSPDGRWLITHSRASVQLWDARTGAPAVLPIKLDASTRSLAFSPDGRFVSMCSMHRGSRANEGNKPVASGSPPAQIGGYQTRLWNVETGQPVTPPLGETNEVTRMEFSPDGRWLLTVANAGSDFALAVRLWSSATGTAVTPPIERTGFSPEVVFSRDGRRLFIVGLASEPIALELPGGRVLHASEWRGFEMQPLAVTADGQRFATHEKGEVRVHDALTGEPLSPPLRNDGELSLDALTFSPDGSVLLARVGDRGQLWPLPREDRPVEELTLLAQLLSGRGIEVSGNFAERSSAIAVGAWQTLRLKYPASFAITPGQVQVWRERIVESSEIEQRWFTVAFHLDQLVREHPDDESLRLRLARARNRAAMEELR